MRQVRLLPQNVFLSQGFPWVNRQKTATVPIFFARAAEQRFQGTRKTAPHAAALSLLSGARPVTLRARSRFLGTVVRYAVIRQKPIRIRAEKRWIFRISGKLPALFPFGYTSLQPLPLQPYWQPFFLRYSDKKGLALAFFLLVFSGICDILFSGE